MFLQHGVKEEKEKKKNFLLLLFFSLIKLIKTKKFKPHQEQKKPFFHFREN